MKVFGNFSESWQRDGSGREMMAADTLELLEEWLKSNLLSGAYSTFFQKFVKEKQQ